MPDKNNYFKGSGTKGSPYLVSEPEQLEFISKFPGCYFLQIKDLNLNNLARPEDFKPISGRDQIYEAGFAGNYDGNGHRITNLKVEAEKESSIGLFSYLFEEAVVKNLQLEDVELKGDEKVGGLAGGVAREAQIVNCSVSGRIEGNQAVGGLVGENDGYIETSFADVEVRGLNDVGGLVGRNWFFAASLDYYLEDSLIRGVKEGAIVNCYARGKVKGEKRVGGLTGFNYGLVENSFSAARILEGKFYLGSLVGANFSGEIVNSYFNKSFSKLDREDENGIELKDENMQEEGSFKGWDFDDVWCMNGKGFPRLKWEV